MRKDTVGLVMTPDVVSVGLDTPFKEVARLLMERGISGLPVVQGDRRVVGVTSETDLMEHQTATDGPAVLPRRGGLAQLTPRARRQAAKAGARSAGQLMTAPPVTVHVDASLARAARTMVQRHVERLPVLDDEDRLAGIVTRSDLLRVFLRTDEEIRDEVVGDVLTGMLWLPRDTVHVSVEGGVVTLTGCLERRGEARIALEMTRRLDGVVDVVDRLTHRLDEAPAQTGGQPATRERQHGR
ncbi:CBS domain-containing protein [Streptomyces sp. MMS24-I2-30]|uniref:CBS domain-containing protein n=1 Tax=Streptomyces sp. MMS24-I2-30 TaxID=3351564 RepID=UPI0038969DD3